MERNEFDDQLSIFSSMKKYNQDFDFRQININDYFLEQEFGGHSVFENFQNEKTCCIKLKTTKQNTHEGPKTDDANFNQKLNEKSSKEEENFEIYQMSLLIIPFSELLKMHIYNDDNHENEKKSHEKNEISFENQNMDENNNNLALERSHPKSSENIEIQIPHFIKLKQIHINVINNFMWHCKNTPQNVQVKRSFPLYLKLLKDKICDKNTEIFMQKELSKLNDKTLKQLIDLCEFLQIRILLDVIYAHIAHKYGVPFGKGQSRQMLRDNHIQAKFAREEMAKLKERYYYFFKELSREFYEEKM